MNTDKHGYTRIPLPRAIWICVHLIAGEPLVVKEIVNAGRDIFAEAWANFGDFIDGTSYLWYLRKNIFKVRCPQVSMFDQRSKPNKVYFELIPDGYRDELLQGPRMTERGKVFYINDERLFWQKPDSRAGSL